jgi:hypothetical protein
MSDKPEQSKSPNWADVSGGIGLGFFLAVSVAQMADSRFILSTLAIVCFLISGALRWLNHRSVDAPDHP